MSKINEVLVADLLAAYRRDASSQLAFLALTEAVDGMLHNLRRRYQVSFSDCLWALWQAALRFQEVEPNPLRKLSGRMRGILCNLNRTERRIQRCQVAYAHRSTAVHFAVPMPEWSIDLRRTFRHLNAKERNVLLDVVVLGKTRVELEEEAQSITESAFDKRLSRTLTKCRGMLGISPRRRAA